MFERDQMINYEAIVARKWRVFLNAPSLCLIWQNYGEMGTRARDIAITMLCESRESAFGVIQTKKGARPWPLFTLSLRANPKQQLFINLTDDREFDLSRNAQDAAGIYSIRQIPYS